MFSLLDDLNLQQQAAVDHDGGPLLVVAGAGSGKTRTLAARLARLLAEGAVPERLLLLTFSRRAARELVARAGSLAGTAGANRVLGGTFHSVGNRLLRRYGTAVGLQPSFTILDGPDAADLLGLLRLELGVAEGRRRFPKKDTLSSIHSRAVNAQRPLTEVVEKWFPWCRDEVDGIRQVFVAYRARKVALQVLDYDDLLLYWRAVMAEPAAAPQLREQFDHVLVDEYQDTNLVQADILFGLWAGGSGPTVCAVGDDAQAIYGFRAASSSNMVEFPERFPGTTIVMLEQNYRSTPPILAAANAVMSATADGFAKALWSERVSGERPRLTACFDETAQADAVCRRVLDHRDRGIALLDQAVLFRTGHHSAGLELELARRNIPFVKYGGLRFLEAAHIKDLMALLRLLDNPKDELAWHRVFALIEGVGPATVRRVWDALGADPLRSFLADAVGALPFPVGAAEEVAGLRAALTDCRGDAGDDDDEGSGGGSSGGATPPPSVQIDRLAEWLGPIVVRRYPGGPARLADLEEMAGLAGPYATRRRFLAEVTLDPPAATSDLAGPPHLDDDWLVLSTIHSAKGGEWKVVHVIHASDGNLPSDMALSDKEGLEEERRLLYVAMTRARDALYVSYPQRFYKRRFAADDVHMYAQPSRFLAPAMTTFDQDVWPEEQPQDGAAFTADGRRPDPVGAFLANLWEE